MRFLQKHTLENIAMEGPEATAEWKNEKIITEKRRLTVDNKKTEMGMHKLLTAQKTKLTTDCSTKCAEFTKMAH